MKDNFYQVEIDPINREKVEVMLQIFQDNYKADLLFKILFPQLEDVYYYDHLLGFKKVKDLFYKNRIEAIMCLNDTKLYKKALIEE